MIMKMKLIYKILIGLGCAVALYMIIVVMWALAQNGTNYYDCPDFTELDIRKFEPNKYIYLVQVSKADTAADYYECLQEDGADRVLGQNYAEVVIYVSERPKDPVYDLEKSDITDNVRVVRVAEYQNPVDGKGLIMEYNK